MAILYSGTEGTCRWTIDDQGHLYIGDGIISHNSTRMDDWSWNTYRDDIISVSSGNISWASGTNAVRMFGGCRSLTSCNLSNFNTSNVTSMEGMFATCFRLTSLDLSDFDTSNVTDMFAMFFACQALINLNLSSFDTSNVTDMKQMFDECQWLEHIIVSNLWNTNQVTNSINMFGSCTSLVGDEGTTYNSSNPTDKTYARIDGGSSNPGYLTDIAHTEMYASFNSSTHELRIFRDISGKYTNGQVVDTITYWTGIEDIIGQTMPKWKNVSNHIQLVNIVNKFKPKTAYYMFFGCSQLTSLNLSNFDTSQVTNMANMFRNCKKLTSLDLSNFDTSNVTTMYGMFDNCTTLTSLDLLNFNTSSVTDMSYMFEKCETLNSLDLLSFNTSNVTNMDYMFYNCQSLTSLNLSSFNTSNVTSMFRMFVYCKALTSLNLSNFDTSNVTNMEGMFYNCQALINLNLSSFDTSNVTNMTHMFDSCLALTLLNLSNFDTSNVINMSYMFESCQSLTALNLSNFNTSNVTNMYAIFEGCQALTSLDLSNFNTSNVTNMSSMFQDCQSLISLDLSSFNTSNVTDMSGMFVRCIHLTSIQLSSNFDTSNVTDMSSMFQACESLFLLDLSNFNTSNVTDMYNMFNNCESLASLTLSSNFDTSNVTDMSYMFIFCKSLTSLTLPSSFDTSKVTDMQAMFYNCESLASLTLSSNFDTSKVTDMYDMFHNCKSLTSLTLPSSFDTSKVTDMGNMFYNCRALTSLDLSGFNTSNVTNMDSMFRTCISLTSIKVSNLWNTNKVTSSTNMLNLCTSLVGDEGTTYHVSNPMDKTYARIDGINAQPGYLTASESTELERYAKFDANNSTLTIFKHFPNQYRDIDGQAINGVTIWTGIEDIVDDTLPKWYSKRSNIQIVNITTKFFPQTCYYMFYQCSHLTVLDLSNFDTSSVTNMSYMFEYCNSLTSLDLSSFDTSNVTSMIFMFDHCNSLTSLNLSSFNTSNVTNMGSMFYNCQSLTSLNLSSFVTSNVTNMRFMFYDCNSLTSLDLSNFDTSNVTSMSYMFEYCNSLTSLDLSSFDTSKVTHMSSMFLGCSALNYLELYVNSNPNTLDIFKNTPQNKQYFIINKKTIDPSIEGTATAEFWIDVASQYSGSVHYEGNDNHKPEIKYQTETTRYFLEEIEPGIYNFNDDDSGDWIKATVNPIILYTDVLPHGWSNSLQNFRCNHTIRKADNTEVTINDLIGPDNLDVYVQVGLLNAVVEFVATDNYHDSDTISFVVNQIFAMVDFVPGGRGMAIGKVAERNGLDISIPTTVGNGLIPPQVINYIKTKDETVNNEKTYYILVNNEYEEVQNPIDTDIENYYELIYITDLDSHQLAIGTYNEIDNSNTYAYIVGNGEDDEDRSNAFTVDWQGRVGCGDYSGVFQSIFDIFYPVGSYYETSDANFNPNTAWGGTWVKDSAGRVTVAQNTNETEFDVVGETGGSKYMQNHAHSFTQPTVTATQQDVNISGGNHNHNAFKAIASKLGSGTTGARIYGQGNTTSGTTTYTTSYETHSHTLPTHTHTLNNGAVNGVQTTSHGTMSTGSSGNLQPYVVVIRWHRTA